MERRRRTAVEQDLARHLKSGYHGPRWTSKQLALLGTMPDEELAAKVGRTATAVRVMRSRLGIPTFQDRRIKGAMSVERIIGGGPFTFD